MIFDKFKDPAKYFPPGYAYEKEQKTVKFLWIVGVGLSFQYFAELYAVVGQLYSDQNGRRVLRNVVAPSFLELFAGHWIFYLPLFLFLVLMIIYHYFYYYNDTKSIYVMHRLPRRAILLKSCAKAPVLGLCITLISLMILYLLYYGIYFIVIPEKCLL